MTWIQLISAVWHTGEKNGERYWGICMKCLRIEFKEGSGKRVQQWVEIGTLSHLDIHMDPELTEGRSVSG